MQSCLTSNLDPRVHTQETSAQFSPPHTFRDYSSRNLHAELRATEAVYRELDSIESKTRTEQLLGCRTRAFFSVNKETRLVRIATNNCRLRWCPICSGALSKFRSSSIKDWLSHQHQTKFATFTLKHSAAGLDHQLKWIYYYFRQLRKTKFFRRICRGGIWFFQVKRSSKDGCWHPHLHCLLNAQFIDHDRLSELWKKITKGSYIVDIRAIRDENDVSDYVARYSSRPAFLSDFTHSDRIEIVSALHGKRLCGKWGTARYCQLTNKIKVDLSAWSNVGSWRSVVNDLGKNRIADLIYLAWQDNTPLPLNLDISVIDKLSFELNPTDLPSLVEYYQNRSP